MKREKVYSAFIEPDAMVPTWQPGHFQAAPLRQPVSRSGLRVLSNVRIWTPPCLQTRRCSGFEVRLHTYPVSCNHIYCRMLDPNGLFARRLPIAITGSKASDILGFVRRRFDLLAIKRHVSQPWLISC